MKTHITAQCQKPDCTILSPIALDFPPIAPRLPSDCPSISPAFSAQARPHGVSNLAPGSPPVRPLLPSSPQCGLEPGIVQSGPPDMNILSVDLISILSESDGIVIQVDIC